MSVELTHTSYPIATKVEDCPVKYDSYLVQVCTTYGQMPMATSRPRRAAVSHRTARRAFHVSDDPSNHRIEQNRAQNTLNRLLLQFHVRSGVAHATGDDQRLTFHQAHQAKVQVYSSIQCGNAALAHQLQPEPKKPHPCTAIHILADE